MKEAGLTKAQIVSELTKSVHAGGAAKRTKGSKLPKLSPDQKIEAQLTKLMTYVPVGAAAVKEDEHFFARLVAWNHQKGTVRDAKVALPVIGLATTNLELLESNLAHLADLRPREFKRAVQFAQKLGVKRNVVRRLVDRYIVDLSREPHWERTAQLHRSTLKWLIARYHVKAPVNLDGVLFKKLYPAKSRFEALKTLSTLTAPRIADLIRTYHFSWLLIEGALGKRLADPDVLAAAIGAMSPNELMANMARLDKLGVKTNAITRAALEQALQTAGGSKTATVFKASKAAAVVQDEALSNKLKAVQEKQLDLQKGIDGDWLIAGDASPSMDEGVTVAIEVAGILARLVRGTVYLGFFSDTPTFFDVTGKSLDEIKQLTRFVKAGGGGTVAGVTLDYLRERNLSINGMAIVGDGGENNRGVFKLAYDRYVKALGHEPAVYFYHLNPGAKFAATHADWLTGQVEMTTIDLRKGVDLYSLPNVVQTMRVGKWSLVDEILQTPLRTLNEVLDKTTTMDVLPAQEAVHA